MFELVINGKVQVFSRQIETLADLLIELNIVADGRVIEVNNSIIEKNKYKQIMLNPNDNIEIIQFMGGG